MAPFPDQFRRWVAPEIETAQTAPDGQLIRLRAHLRPSQAGGCSHETHRPASLPVPTNQASVMLPKMATGLLAAAVPATLKSGHRSPFEAPSQWSEPRKAVVRGR